MFGKSYVLAVGLAVALTAAAPRPAVAQADRWQVTLNNGSYLWELHLLALHGDTLLVTQADTVIRLPLETIDELRLVQKLTKRAGARGGNFESLVGASDTVFKLSLYKPDERRDIVQRIFRELVEPAQRADHASGGATSH